MSTKTTQLLFNPFLYVAGWTSLWLGLFIMFLTALLGYFSNMHLEGVIGVGIGVPAPFYVFVFEAIGAWLILSLMLFITGKITSKTSFRLLDILGTQALARAPMLLAPLISFPEFNRRVTQYLLWKFLGLGDEVIASQVDIVLYVLVVLLMLLIVIWTITLMYNAYKVCCNLKGAKTGISFTIALILAHFTAFAFFFFAFSDSYFNPQEFISNL